MSLIVKRLASVSIQDAVYSRQIPRYLESYIPVYTYKEYGYLCIIGYIPRFLDI